MLQEQIKIKRSEINATNKGLEIAYQKLERAQTTHEADYHRRFIENEEASLVILKEELTELLYEQDCAA